MATITFHGKPVNTVGKLPAIGKIAPAFTLVNTKLEDIGLINFAGKRKLLNIVPSLDTGVCATSARNFNSEAGKISGAVVLNISADLPFAAGRFCESANLENIIPLSTFRAPEFGRDYGVTITDGPLCGLLSRAVIVLDEDNKVLYTEQVPEIGQEPDYAAALQAIKSEG